MQNEDAQKLADKIVAIISAESPRIDLSSLQRSLHEIEHRLSTLETAISNSKSRIPNPQPEITNLRQLHPSQDRFAIAEAIVDSLFERDAKEKACTFEPNGKPCDHCSMCNSRGF